MLFIDKGGDGPSVGEVPSNLDQTRVAGTVKGRIGIDPVKSTVQNPDHHARSTVPKPVNKVHLKLPGLGPSGAVGRGPL